MRSVLAMTLLAAIGCEPAPTYQGKTARQWLRQAEDADPGFRREAQKALLSMPENALPAGKRARVVLDYCEPLGAEAMPYLVPLLQNKDPEVRRRAARGVAKFGYDGQAQSAVPSLVALLKDPDPAVRTAAVAALGNYGAYRKADAAIPALTELAKGGDEAAKDALAKIQHGNEEAVAE